MIGISTKTVYAVAAIYELGMEEEENILKIKEIAQRADVPQSFLEQILLELKKQGVLTSVKGANGGYKLAKDLKDITLKEIVSILETDAFSDICRTDNPALKLFWEDMRVKIEEVFDVPLSELIQYQMKANGTLNFYI